MTENPGTDRSAILQRTLIAAGIGIAVACLVLLPALTLLESCFEVRGCGGPSLIDTLAGLAGIGIAALIFGAAIWLPLLGAVLLVGALFWRRIASRPALWAFGFAVVAFLPALFLFNPGIGSEAGSPLDLAFAVFLLVALCLPAAIFARMSHAGR